MTYIWIALALAAGWLVWSALARPAVPAPPPAIPPPPAPPDWDEE